MNSSSYQKQYYLKNKSRLKTYKKYYAKNNRGKLNKLNKKYRAKMTDQQKQNHAKQIREWNLVNKYGISLDEYEKLLKIQNDNCGTNQTRLAKNLHVDHCHKTKKVRGLLCQKCNMALGLLNDDELLFLRAVDYIRRFK